MLLRRVTDGCRAPLTASICVCASGGRRIQIIYCTQKGIPQYSMTSYNILYTQIYSSYAQYQQGMARVVVAGEGGAHFSRFICCWTFGLIAMHR